MAKNQTSAEKRHKQSEARRLRNKTSKTRCKNSVKKFLEAIKSKDKGAASSSYNDLQSELDVARRKGVIKLNAAARKKSRMMALFNKTFADR